MKRKSEQGVALIITLILLAIITFLTLAFLALSRRELASVATTTEQTKARLATEAAVERAKADLLAGILGTSNKWHYGLRVSTNYDNRFGFQRGLLSYTNVSYHYPDGTPIQAADLPEMLANMFWDPRAPVLATNPVTGLAEFRYYLDLNRNGRFETNGNWPVIGPNGGFLRADGTEVATPEGVLTNHFIGDPEWVGIKARADRPHGTNNYFISRFAYLVVPVGQTLDFNAIHNQALRPDPALDGFWRSQGVGTWELNLAAALRDLNTNYWWDPAFPTDFLMPPPRSGPAYNDAKDLLTNRYAGNWANLARASDYFPPLATTTFPVDLVDQYSDDPTVPGLLASLVDNDLPARPWPGAENPNSYYTTQDFFSLSNRFRPFTSRLYDAGTREPSYDRYTFYRLLSVLGTDTGSEPPTRLHLNYMNVRSVDPTNMVKWDPADFFTNAAIRLLGKFQPHGITNLLIPVYIPVAGSSNGAFTNLYTPAVHRLLQVAANVHDAGRGATLGEAYPYLPSVFRPIFRRSGSGNSLFIAIVGYEEVRDLNVLSATIRDLKDPQDAEQVGPRDMIYGVPLVIGARKGYPNFNQFALQSVVEASRRIQLRKPTASEKVNEINQMFIIGISNRFGVEAWNSYMTNYPRELEMRVAVDMRIELTNAVRTLMSTNVTLGAVSNVPALSWPAFYANGSGASFKLPVSGGYWVLTNSIYAPLTNGDGALYDLLAGFPRGGGFLPPALGLRLENRVRFVLVDRSLNRIVDYVNLSDLDNGVDITGALSGARLGSSGSTPNEPTSVIGDQWKTNITSLPALPGLHASLRNLPLPEGLLNQINVSLGVAPYDNVPLSVWNNFSGQGVNVQDKAKGIDAMRVFVGLPPKTYPSNYFAPTNLTMQVPFTPSRKVYLQTTYEANDPLVHYLPGDLMSLARTNDVNYLSPPNSPLPALRNLGDVNERYRPWGGNPAEMPNTNSFNLAIKDPLVLRSDDWEFPTNVYPNVGALGRVHRGTPWQTLYLKAADTSLGNWMEWTGNPAPLDANIHRPVADWPVFDLFTAAPNVNATRGQLSVNARDLAAWSAVLTGVRVLTNTKPDAVISDPSQPPGFDTVEIQPAGTNGFLSPLGRLVASINARRADTNYFPLDAFESVGEILSVPEFSVGDPQFIPGVGWTNVSPFINLGSPNNGVPTVQQMRGLTDEAYEAVPRQILSLLRGDDDPRFVVYAWGQALKPAPRSMVPPGGPFGGMVTNYQITAEFASRTVVRVVGAPSNAAPWRWNPPRRAFVPPAAPRLVVEKYNVLPPD